MKVCGGKPQIQFRIPKSLKFALGTQVLTADDISVIFIKIKRMLDTHPIDNTAVVQVELPIPTRAENTLALNVLFTLIGHCLMALAQVLTVHSVLHLCR